MRHVAHEAMLWGIIVAFWGPIVVIVALYIVSLPKGPGP